MKQLRKTLLTTCFMLIFFSLKSYAEAETPHRLNGLSVRLISDHSTIKAGEPFLLGFHIQHQKGYHTYWKNPGLVGLATSLEWKMPKGYKVSAINWPYPELSSMAGNPCYGYERDVTLYVTVIPPMKIASKTISISVDAMWMCCAKNCFPGSKNLSIDIAVGQIVQKNTSNEALFALAIKQTPLPYSHTNTKLLSNSKEQSIRLQISTPLTQPLDTVYLFSVDDQISSAKKQTIEKLPDGSWVINAQRSKYSPENMTSLPAVLKIGNEYHSIEPNYSK